MTDDDNRELIAQWREGPKLFPLAERIVDALEAKMTELTQVKAELDWAVDWLYNGGTKSLEKEEIYVEISRLAHEEKEKQPHGANDSTEAGRQEEKP